MAINDYMENTYENLL